MRCFDVGRAEHLDVLDDVVDVAVAADQAEDPPADLVAPRRPTCRRRGRTARTARTPTSCACRAARPSGRTRSGSTARRSPGDGMPRVQSSNAAWASSIGTVIETGARFGQSASGSAVQRGSRDSPQLSFTTGLVVRQASIRDRNDGSSRVAEQAEPVTFGSAFETTARARITSPPSSTTPSPGRISATGDAGGEHRARLRARPRRWRTRSGPCRPRRSPTPSARPRACPGSASA